MIRIHDTRLKRKIPFEPREPGKIGMYVCGITVYDLCHVGHARSAVAFDVIARYLRQRGFQVKLVKNITDVDDKIIRRAQAEGRTAAEVAETYIQAMADDFRALGLAPPDSEPRATQHIDDVIGVVRGWRSAAWPTPPVATCITPSAALPGTAACPGRAPTS
jgi:cysteinyl-tRNA synthetase